MLDRPPGIRGLTALTTLLVAACANVPPLEDPVEPGDAGASPAPPSGPATGGNGGVSPTPPTTAPTTPPPPPEPPPPAPTEGLVEGLSVRSLIAAQSLEAPVDPDRGVTAVPIVAAKEVVVHALVDAAPGFTPQTVRAVLEVDSAVYEDTLQITGSSNPDTLEGAFRFDLPAEAVTTSTRLGLRLLALNNGPERQAGHPASWPQSGALAPLGAVTAGRLKVVVFPVLGTQFGAHENEFHATPERIAAIRRSLLATYPVTESSLEIEVRPTFRFDAAGEGSCMHWDSASGHEVAGPCVPLYALFDAMVMLHAREGADFHTVYLGVFSFDESSHGVEGGKSGVGVMTTLEDLRQGSYPLGAVALYDEGIPLEEKLWRTPEDVAFATDFVAQEVGCDPTRVQASIEYQLVEDGPHTTILHEIGHTLTLHHVDSPAHTFPADEREPAYPRPRGDIGLAGYDIRRDHRFDSRCTMDLMSYAALRWLSDFGLQRIHIALTDPGVRAAPVAASPQLVAVVRLGEAAGAPHFGWRAASPPSDTHAAVPVRAEAADARLVRSVTGRFAPFSDGRAGHLFVPEVAGAHHYVADLDGRRVTIAAGLAGE